MKSHLIRKLLFTILVIDEILTSLEKSETCGLNLRGKKQASFSFTFKHKIKKQVEQNREQRVSLVIGFIYFYFLTLIFNIATICHTLSWKMITASFRQTS